MITMDKIEAMVQRIVEEFHPDKVILFGSCARNEITEDSDADFLVVMPVERDRLELTVDVMRQCFGFGVPKDVFVLTPEEFEGQKDAVGTMAYTAHHEGKILYAR